MFGDNVTRILLGIQNEQRAQKVATRLNYGALTRPEDTPSASWSGNVAVPPPSDTNYVAARWHATFTRSDGVDSTPFVDFAWDFSLGKYYYRDKIDAGLYSGVSGRDAHAMDEMGWNDGIVESGSNFVKWLIDINKTDWSYFSTNGTNVNLSVQAISPVQGSLTLVRVI